MFDGSMVHQDTKEGMQHRVCRVNMTNRDGCRGYPGKAKHAIIKRPKEVNLGFLAQRLVAEILIWGGLHCQGHAKIIATRLQQWKLLPDGQKHST